MPSRAASGPTGLKSSRLAGVPANLLTSDAATRLTEKFRADDTLVFVSAHAPVKNVAMLTENVRMGEAVCAALKIGPLRMSFILASMLSTKILPNHFRNLPAPSRAVCTAPCI